MMRVFLFDPQTGESFLLNESGRTIFNELKQGTAEPAVGQKLQHQYDISEAEAQADMTDFIQQLRILQLV